MIDSQIVICLFWLHFFGDFILQTDAMALNKSRSIFWLSVHCLVYSLPLLLIGFKYAIINTMLHFVVDFYSSIMCARFWAKGDRYSFFATIGMDQAIHMTCLVATYGYMRGVV